MKRNITKLTASLLITFYCSLLTVFAQAPQALNYQAVARNSSGTLIANQVVGIKIYIHQTSASGPDVYSETFTPTTNKFGLFTVAIGQGTVVSGTFNSITWNTGNYWLDVQMDPSGGTNYTDMGAAQLLSVPYAIYANNAGASKSGGSNGEVQFDSSGTFAGNANLFWDNTNKRLGIGTKTPQQPLSVNAGMNIDQGGLDTGTVTNALTFGTNSGTTSGEGIGSNRGGGLTNQWGIDFYTDFTNRMAISNTGNVGIGTANPGKILDINAGAATTAQARLYSNGTDAAISFMNYGTGGRTYWWDAGSNGSGVGAGNFGVWDVTAGATRLVIDQYGYVGIGTTIPKGLLDVENSSLAAYLVADGYAAVFEGNVVPSADNTYTLGSSSLRWSTVYSANGVVTTSDERDKENIKEISYGLSEIMKLRPVSFTWKDNPGYGTKLGLIAQEVEPVLGEVVKKENITHGPAISAKGASTDYRYGVYYSDIIPVLIKAVQELNTKNEELQKQLYELKASIKK
jgi:hypothetical protein